MIQICDVYFTDLTDVTLVSEDVATGDGHAKHVHMREYADTCACQNPHEHVSTYKMGHKRVVI